MHSDDSNGKMLLSRRSRLSTAISLVQPLSVVVGGCWIAFLYFTYQEKSDAASLKEKQLSIRQAEIVLETQEQSNNLDVNLKKISVEQGRIALATQVNESELKKAQLATEVELKKQEVALNSLKQKQQEHDVQYSTSCRSSYEATLRAGRIGAISGEFSNYKASLEFTLKNDSTVDCEISYIAVEYYSRAPEQDLGVALGEVVVLPVGTPPSLVNPALGTGTLPWFRLGPPTVAVWRAAVGHMGYYDYLVDGTTSSIHLNGPNTGSIVGGGRTRFGSDYIVRARPGIYLAFVVDWIINRAKGGDDDVYSMTRIVRLPNDNEVAVDR